MPKSFDAKAAAADSLRARQAEEQTAQQGDEIALDAALRVSLQKKHFDWDRAFNRQHRRENKPPPPPPFSKLNKRNPFGSVVGGLRILHASLAHSRSSGVTWLDAIAASLVGLRAELLDVAQRIEASHPEDAARLRKMVDVTRSPFLEGDELDYEVGRIDGNLCEAKKMGSAAR